MNGTELLFSYIFMLYCNLHFYVKRNHLVIIMKIKLIAIYYCLMPLTELNIINYSIDCVTRICMQLYYDY